MTNDISAGLRQDGPEGDRDELAATARKVQGLTGFVCVMGVAILSLVCAFQMASPTDSSAFPVGMIGGFIVGLPVAGLLYLWVKMHALFVVKAARYLDNR